MPRPPVPLPTDAPLGSIERFGRWLQRWADTGRPELELVVRAGAVHVRPRTTPGPLVHRLTRALQELAQVAGGDEHLAEATRQLREAVQVLDGWDPGS
jgi:hypothetical protein